MKAVAGVVGAVATKRSQLDDLVRKTAYYCP
jgi:hypothetical protein